MAAIARPGVCKNRNRQMSKKLTATAPSVASGKVPAPVRVRLKRLSTGRSESRVVAATKECLGHFIERFRRSLAASAHCSGTAAEQRDLRNRCERQLGVHRGRQAQR